MAMHNALWELINQTDIVSKGILLSMLGMSLACWSLALYKWMVLKAKIQQVRQARALIRNINNLEDLLARAATVRNTFGGDLIAQYLLDFKMALKKYDTSKPTLTQSDWNILMVHIDQTLEDTLQKEEALLPVFSTSYQAAPLVGLFGTVWGLIHAFIGIGQQKSADIAAVAPGIAEALITTLSGLVVAIPALVLFNYLQHRVRILETEVLQLTESCRLILRQVTTLEENTSVAYSMKSKDKAMEVSL
ncbi:MotA/TolQ/ExbB proton channel family protein [Candidatus Dependentiae bacterium]|nr:MotA/TolQ/ExbB proton channel family protein [Candidatus Dependentiae bacterium]